MYGAGDSARESVANYLELGRDPASLQTPRAGDRSLHRPAHSAAPAHPGPAGPTPRPPAPPGQLLGLGTSRVVISLPTVVSRRLSHRPDARPENKHRKKKNQLVARTALIGRGECSKSVGIVDSWPRPLRPTPPDPSLPPEPLPPPPSPSPGPAAALAVPGQWFMGPSTSTTLGTGRRRSPEVLGGRDRRGGDCGDLLDSAHAGSGLGTGDLL